MGLIEEVLAMAGSSGSQQTEHASALSAILAYINSPQVGGIGGLQKMFQQGGLGSVVNSWIGSGQNMSVSPGQLQNVVHSGALEQAAQQSGIDPTHLMGMMSTLLPHLVDKLTPNGQVPDANSLMQMLKGQAAAGA